MDTYKTSRLILRPTSLDDASFILKLVNTPSWHRYIGDRKVYTLKDARKYIRDRILPQFKRLGYGNYTMILQSDGSPVGTCGLFDREGLQGVDIGFALLPEYEGRGYAYEAASEILRLAFTSFGLDRVQAICTPDNYSSQKLIKKLGLEYVRDLRLPDDPADLLLFAINKPEPDSGHTEL